MRIFSLQKFSQSTRGRNKSPISPIFYIQNLTVKYFNAKIFETNLKEIGSTTLMLNDSYAYIPLFASATVTFVIFILLFFIRKKNTARVSFVAFISSFLIAFGLLASAIINLNDTSISQSNSLLLLSVFIFIASLLILPYCIILTTFEPKKIEKLVPSSSNKKNVAEVPHQTTLPQNQEKIQVTENDSKILNISKSFMTKAISSFSSENDLNDLFKYINTTIKDEVNADGGAILMVDDFEDIITVKSLEGDFPPPYKLPNDMPHKPVRVATNFKFASFPLRENIFGEIATAGKGELITKPELDDRIYQNGPEEFLECGSYIFIPMKSNDTVIGLVALARKRTNPLFTQDDYNSVESLVDFATLTIKTVLAVKDIIEHNSIVKEADIASRIQYLLHPTKLPIISGIQIGTLWNPLEGVCGDYYDIIPARKDRISFVMSDVAGKGINSVTIMAMMRAMLRLVINTTQSASTILEWVNHGIAQESFSTDHFASCALINYNPQTHIAEIATGGTTPVYYYNVADNSFTKISHASEPIGVDKNSTYKNILQETKPGDILITYTDGLIETLNDKGQQYTKENLLKLIAKNHNSSSKDIANLVKSDIKNFSAGTQQHDDQSLLVIKF